MRPSSVNKCAAICEFLPRPTATSFAPVAPSPRTYTGTSHSGPNVESLLIESVCAIWSTTPGAVVTVACFPIDRSQIEYVPAVSVVWDPSFKFIAPYVPGDNETLMS
jgi:hypothetical protein